MGPRAKLNFPELDLPAATITEIRREAIKKWKEKTTSRFRGVCLTEKGWLAQIVAEGQHKHLGFFRNEMDAATAYDDAARAAFGDRAMLNFPTTLERGENGRRSGYVTPPEEGLHQGGRPASTRIGAASKARIGVGAAPGVELTRREAAENESNDGAAAVET